MRICSAGLSFLKSCPQKSDRFGFPVQVKAWNNYGTPHPGNYPEFPEDYFIRL